MTGAMHGINSVNASQIVIREVSLRLAGQMYVCVSVVHVKVQRYNVW